MALGNSPTRIYGDTIDLVLMPEDFGKGQRPEGFRGGQMPGGRGQNGFGQMNMENAVTEFEIKEGSNMYMVVSNKL